MQTKHVAAVLGAGGFLGRYITRRLLAAEWRVRAGGRDPEQARVLQPMGVVGQVVPFYADLTRPDTLERFCEGATLVINLVGILAESRRGDFDRVHGEGAGAVAREAARAGAADLIHVSAIGADPDSPSAYGRSKAEGEARVREAFPHSVVLRPSIVFGAEDQFFNRFAALARLSPIMPVIAGNTRFQPVFVDDVAKAAMASIGNAAARGGIFELGGPDIFTFRELLGIILARTGYHRPLVAVPDAAASLLARMPFSGLTTDQLLMLRRDNVVAVGAPGFADLGITPTPVDLVVPDYLARFRKPGVLAPGR